MAADTNKAAMLRFVEFINTGSEKLAEEFISPERDLPCSDLG